MKTTCTALSFVLLALAACTSVGGLTPPGSPPAQTASPEGSRGADGVLAIEALPMGSTAPTGCSLTVQFGSYAEGISDPTGIVDLLQRDRRVSHITMIPWGREGERNYCVRTRSAADAQTLANGLRPLVAGPPGRRGFVVVLIGEREVARTPPRTD